RETGTTIGESSMNMTQEKQIEEQGPTFAMIWHNAPDFFEDITISYAGRMMPWRRASGLSAADQAKARNGEIVVIGGCPASSGTTWRQVVYRGGRYRSRIPSATVVEAVDRSVNDWRCNKEG